jgi:hypothetical protein
VALADPIQILLILSVLAGIPVLILAMLFWYVYNRGKSAGRLETRASENLTTRKSGGLKANDEIRMSFL